MKYYDGHCYVFVISFVYIEVQFLYKKYWLLFI